MKKIKLRSIIILLITIFLFWYILKDNFVNPMIKFGKFMTSTAYNWFKESFITPISKWTSVIGRELMHQGKNLTYYIKEGISWRSK